MVNSLPIFNLIFLNQVSEDYNMDEPLWNKFLEEDVDDLQVCLIYYGVTGILERFEQWLKNNGHISTGCCKSE